MRPVIILIVSLQFAGCSSAVVVKNCKYLSQNYWQCEETYE